MARATAPVAPSMRYRCAKPERSDHHTRSPFRSTIGRSGGGWFTHASEGGAAGPRRSKTSGSGPTRWPVAASSLTSLSASCDRFWICARRCFPSGVQRTAQRYSSASPRADASPPPQSTSIHVVGKRSVGDEVAKLRRFEAREPTRATGLRVARSGSQDSPAGDLGDLVEGPRELVPPARPERSTTPNVTRVFLHPGNGYAWRSSAPSTSDAALDRGPLISNRDTSPASARANARAQPSGRHHTPRSRPSSSTAVYSARPCVTIGRPCAPCVTRVG